MYVCMYVYMYMYMHMHMYAFNEFLYIVPTYICTHTYAFSFVPT